MRIAIDGYEANVPDRLGSSQVAFELLKNLEKIDQKNHYLIFLPSAPLSDLPKERQGWRYQVLKPNKLWTRVALPLALLKSRQKPDVIFSPTHYIPRFLSVKRVVTVFDLSYLHFPEMFKKNDLYKLTNWTKYSIENADQIITISEFSKKDIIKNYDVKEDRVTVAYPGHNARKVKESGLATELSQLKKRLGVKDAYLIYIGTIQPRKNLSKLIAAFAEISGVQLVIVGKFSGVGREGWMYQEILELPKKLGIEDKVIFTNFLPDKELNALLAGALAYIQPSLWEGFGIPAVDAMSCGVPVLVSDVSSLPEITGEAALTFDPNSEDSIRMAIQKIISDKALRTKLSERGVKQSEKFSWSNMAQTVLSVLEKVGSA